MKVYISGKIGEEKPSLETLEKFKKAETVLREHGYEVFNPTTSGLGKIADEKVLEAERRGEKTTWYQEILKLDLDALSFCDGIYLLNFDEKVGRGIIEVAPEKSYNKVREDWGIKNIDRVWLPL